MKNIKYHLETYSGSKSRHICPKCGDKNSFTYYVNIDTGEPINKNCGRCNHESGCGYHKTPLFYFSNNADNNIGKIDNYIWQPPAPKPVSYFDRNYFEESELYPQDNNLLRYLFTIFELPVMRGLIYDYRIGTTDHWNGATIFWYLDTKKRVTSGKIIQYDRLTGKRVKSKKGIPRINSIRNILMKKGLIPEDFNQKKILFGEHLLVTNPKTPVCIVESEKTAIIADGFFPKYTWLATGGRSFLTDERIGVLKGRDVTIYPDNDAFEFWSKKAVKYDFKVSTLVKEKYPEPKADLADYILSYYGK